MTRFFATTAAIVMLPCAGMAQDIVLRADIAEAVVNAAGAEITRQADVSLPAGRTELFIAMPDVDWSGLFQVTGPDGVQFGPPQTVDGMALSEGQLDTDAQAAARAAVAVAEDALVAAQDDLARSDTALRAIEAQLAYLDALTRGGDDGTPMPEDPGRIAQVLATLGAEMQRVSRELVEARAERRALDEAVKDRQDAVQRARAALVRLRPFEGRVAGLQVVATAQSDINGQLTISYQAEGVTWTPSYDLRLDSESGALRVDPIVTLRVDNPSRWQDVDVSFSTANPSLQRAPRDVTSTPARIFEPPEPRVGRTLEMEDATFSAAPMEPVMIMEPRTALEIDGLAVSYDYGTPVSVGPSGAVQLPFDPIALNTETEARGAPRFDDTAFLVAMGENTGDAPILPGEARFYRDGALVGEDRIDLIPTGADFELAFGSLDHLPLIWIDRSNLEGDRGVFVSSNTQRREIAFGVENSGDQPEAVRLIYAVPFTEQEDLELDVTLSPVPDERDIDDRRGVHAWDVEVAPGARALVELEVMFRWPEGQMLNWQP